MKKMKFNKRDYAYLWLLWWQLYGSDYTESG